jgi:hypothetical protein
MISKTQVKRELNVAVQEAKGVKNHGISEDWHPSHFMKAVDDLRQAANTLERYAKENWR